MQKLCSAGKSVSEALILESVNPQYEYDDILFIDSQLQYNKNTSLEHAVYKNCFLYTTCSKLSDLPVHKNGINR